MRRKFVKFYPHFAPSDLFAVVDDIESYPSFVPLCQKARVIAREGAWRRVENSFGFGRVGLSFITEARADPPRELVIDSAKGVMRAFRMRWRFEPQGGGCLLTCDLTLEFSSPALNALALLAASDFEHNIMAAFERRVAARSACQG